MHDATNTQNGCGYNQLMLTFEQCLLVLPLPSFLSDYMPYTMPDQVKNACRAPKFN